MFVLDTNTIAYFFRGEGKVARRMFSNSRSELAVPAIVACELRYGLGRLKEASRRMAELEHFIESIEVLAFDDLAAHVAAGVRVALERAGEPIGPLDLLIAATCLRNDGILVTRNVNEFRRVGGLKVENWFD